MEVGKLVLQYLTLFAFVFFTWHFREEIRLLVRHFANPDRRGSWKLPGGIEYQELQQAALEAGKKGAEIHEGEKALEQTVEQRLQLVEDFARKASIGEEERQSFLTQLAQKDEEVELLQRRIRALETSSASGRHASARNITNEWRQAVRELGRRGHKEAADQLEELAGYKLQEGPGGMRLDVALGGPANAITPQHVAIMQGLLFDLLLTPVQLAIRLPGAELGDGSISGVR